MFCLVFEKIKIKMLEVGTSKAESKLRPGLMCPVLTRVLMSFKIPLQWQPQRGTKVHFRYLFSLTTL
jgi:hypothetical protein